MMFLNHARNKRSTTIQLSDSHAIVGVFQMSQVCQRIREWGPVVSRSTIVIGMGLLPPTSRDSRLLMETGRLPGWFEPGHPRLRRLSVGVGPLRGGFFVNFSKKGNHRGQKGSLLPASTFFSSSCTLCMESR